MNRHPIVEGSRIALRLIALTVACTAFILGQWLAGIVLAAMALFFDQLLAAYVALRRGTDERPRQTH